MGASKRRGPEPSHHVRKLARRAGGDPCLRPGGGCLHITGCTVSPQITCQSPNSQDLRCDKVFKEAVKRYMGSLGCPCSNLIGAHGGD